MGEELAEKCSEIHFSVFIPDDVVLLLLRLYQEDLFKDERHDLFSYSRMAGFVFMSRSDVSTDETDGGRVRIRPRLFDV